MWKNVGVSDEERTAFLMSDNKMLRMSIVSRFLMTWALCPYVDHFTQLVSLGRADSNGFFGLCFGPSFPQCVIPSLIFKTSASDP